MAPGESAHHRTLAPTSVQGADGSIIMEAFDPEGEMPYYYAVGEAGRPDYGAVRVSHGDRSTFYGWLEGTLAWVTSPFRCAEPSQRVISPPPEASQFETADAFHAEQACWYRDHGDGSELQGTRREQNTLFDRLRDKLLGHRRHRANPSGTRRNTISN